MPGVAQVAIQQGRYAGKLIHSTITGSATPAPFRYFDKGNLAVVGKGFAVLQSGKIHLSGSLAWLVWAAVHIQFLAQWGTRISVFLQWMWTFLTGERGSRLIVNHRGSEQVTSKPLNPATEFLVNSAGGTRGEPAHGRVGCGNKIHCANPNKHERK